MAQRVIACFLNGKIVPVPSGDTIGDAGGNPLGGGLGDNVVENIDCSANPNYPAADEGDIYAVSVAGKIGGASGIDVEVGDVAICKIDSSPAGDHATVGTNWVILSKNILDTAAAIRKRYVFVDDVYFDGQNQLTGVLGMDVVAPFDGYMVGASIKLSDARTAGTLDAEPHKNGVGLTPTGLDLQIAASPTTKDNASVAYGTTNYDFTAGDTIGFLITTTTFAPATKATLVLAVEG